ncbi:DUF6786 family protein [Larkinella insperata]|uniref:DUF6786 family protein n=1 Tax=Larkinella insperata TaxID=332158 RepID=A0ABW3QA18_9BACT|nr:DUF6786 family protein [Larkinella insperata]
MKKITHWAILPVLAGAIACQSNSSRDDQTTATDTTQTRMFTSDAAFLKKHHPDLVTLKDGNAQVLICPAYQGRIMTSTADGETSYGWINRELIESGKLQPHMNAFGGEDRFWLGPEGGQFAIYFKPGAEFNGDNWQTPAPIDSEPFTLVSKDERSARFSRDFELTNYSGTKFSVGVEREVHLLRSKQINLALGATGVPLSDSLKIVGVESVNTLINRGKEPWKKENGLLSVWILGMFNAAPDATIVVPFQPGKEPAINDSYFGNVPASRLIQKDSVGFFRADANERGKIGVPPSRAKNWLGSYDPNSQTLTLVTFTFNPANQDYVNSAWEIQKEPYAGDVANAYNDGPMKPDQPQMGKFYELESSSPAAALSPGGRLTHRHTTLHIQGKPAQLDEIARRWLGVSLDEIVRAF